jgi:hypothetical protein
MKTRSSAPHRFFFIGLFLQSAVFLDMKLGPLFFKIAGEKFISKPAQLTTNWKNRQQTFFVALLFAMPALCQSSLSVSIIDSSNPLKHAKRCQAPDRGGIFTHGRFS